MAQQLSYRCDCCGTRIDEEEDCPLVAYLVVGRIGGDGQVRYFEEELPPFLEALMQLPTARRDFCAHCFGHAFQVGKPAVAAVLEDAVGKHGLDRSEATRILARMDPPGQDKDKHAK
jgi:hypothetical protein